MDAASSTRLDIVVPVHGGWSHVADCLAALETQTSRARIIVVDDLSPDDTLARIRERFPQFTIIANATNLGFAATCNVGMRSGSSEFVLLLNSDVVAVPSMVDQILDSFDSAAEDSLGSVASVLLAPDGTIDSFGITADVTGAGFVRFHGSQVHDIHAHVPPVLGPYGAAAAYRRAALEDVGLLDENIFMYGEELELALRLRTGGWGALAVPFIAGTHIGGASAGTESERQRYLSGFGRGYLLRVYGVLQGRHAARAIVTEAIVTGARLVLRRDLASLKGRLSGWRKGYRVPRRALPTSGLDTNIGFRLSLKMRSPDYWKSLAKQGAQAPRGRMKE
ncbi:GT2 family glycosyltransferase [Microbacterium endophyticum]|uniref:GT2 family glycosyltransferase n=1 Tax=Microbacterium endophyticum TaxID=1526412 RepID=A0A7W4V3T5_9MICO|nr:glycosyltransferase [Microbacterium endophyticum]MBB2976348.1 GT2 family glycosyltransferase [Microbacterium endophyticum]NIK35228.1 GT2 family glycosyltransferase [Microbacterium endophyticum]